MTQELVSNTLLFIGVLLGPLSALVLLFWFVGLAFQDLKRELRQAYRRRTIPCYGCLYFSGREELKCAVNPCDAMTQAAQHCRDFSPSDTPKEVAWWQHKL
ncbi:MAG: hypothetical protein AAGH78_17770 [Cyanobacteria bacterium P01_H01_bin.58]